MVHSQYKNVRNVNEREIMVGAGIWREVRGSEYEMQTVCLCFNVSSAFYEDRETCHAAYTRGGALYKDIPLQKQKTSAQK